VKNIHEPQDEKGNTLQRCKKTKGKCWQMFSVSQFKTHAICGKQMQYVNS
jgi:hypothetical protein